MVSKQFVKSSGYLERIENNSPIGHPLLYKESYVLDITKNTFDIVPISVRYNINSIVGLGLGAQISSNFYQKSNTEEERKVYYYIPGNQQEEEITSLYRKIDSENVYKKITLNNYGLFLDFTIGVSRIGPSAGLRYIQNFNKPTKQLHAYAIWKF